MVGALSFIIALLLILLILFFGAEFTKQFSVYYKHEITPARDAELITDAEKEKEK